MKYQENVLENFIKSAMGNLKLKEFHITSNGELSWYSQGRSLNINLWPTFKTMQYNMNRFRFIKVRDVKSPSRGNEGDAGLDFYIPEDLTLQDLVKANSQLMFHSETPEPGKVSLGYNSNNQVQFIYIFPFTRILIPSGIRGLLEPRYSMLMAANKSGISTKMGLIYTAEIVDSPYTGEIHIGVYNTSHEIQVIEAGTKLVQFIHVPIYLTEPEEVIKEEFDEDASTWGTRGNKGFGSTN